MKLISMECPSCGAKLEVNSELQSAMCNFCGKQFTIDPEIVHVHHDLSEDAGYKFELGRIKAQEEAQERARQAADAERARLRAAEAAERERLRQAAEKAQREAERQKSIDKLTQSLTSKGVSGTLFAIIALVIFFASKSVVAFLIGVVLLISAIYNAITIIRKQGETPKRFWVHIIGIGFFVVLNIVALYHRFGK